jgi:tetratricopeptide (TPR) repeat protein
MKSNFITNALFRLRPPSGLKQLRLVSASIALLLIMPFAGVVAQGTSAQHSNVATIQGTVINSDGCPLGDAVVRLEREGVPGFVETTTNPAGAFTFSALQVGSYLISAEKTGSRSPVSTILASSQTDAEKIRLTIATTASETSDHNRSSSAATQPMQFSDQPNFTVAGVTDWTSVGGHGSDSSLRTSEALANETLTLRQPASGQNRAGVRNGDAKATELENRLRASLADAPDTFEANHLLGSFYLKTGRYSDATPLLRRAYKIDPKDHDNNHDLAMAYEESGDLSQAREHIHEMLAHEESADLHRLTGDIDEKLGDPLAAVHEYERAVHLDRSEQNYFAWGSELLLHRAVWQAQEVFRKGAEEYSRSARMQTGLGAALFAGALYDEAALHLCHASELNPADPEPYIFMGKMQIVAPNPLACVEPKLAQFVQRQPENSFANYFYARAILKRQERTADKQAMQQVEALLLKAVAIDSTCADAYLQLGILSSSRGDLATAITYYSKAIKANQQLGDAYYRLAVAYDRIGEPAKAKQEFQLHDEVEKQQAAVIEQQRRSVKQFLVLLPGQSTLPPAR